MKKRLLLAALALVSTVGTFAFNVGDYVYTATQRVKIAGENLVANGAFKDGLTAGGWCSSATDGKISTSTWTVVDGEGPDGESVIKSLGATADENLCNVWSGLEGGQMYVVSFQIKGEGAANTTVGTTVGNNYADFFLNGDASLAHAASTDDAPVVNVATASSFGEEWKTIAFTFTPDEGQSLVMHFEKMATGTMITNISLHKAKAVYDDRIVLRKLAFADKILADPNFNETDQAKAAHEEFESGIYTYIKGGLDNDPETEGANFDEIEEGEAMMISFDEGLAEFMNASTDNMATEENFKYVTSTTSFPKYNRKGIKANTAYGGFMFRQNGDDGLPKADGAETNWQHGSGGEYISLAIQGNYSNPGGSIALYNKTLPAGKYYIAAEMRNGYMDKNYVRTYTLEKNVKAFIGTDTVDCGMIVGEDATKFYMVGELKEGETFEAGFFWEGHNAGSAFDIKNFECRAFGNLAAEAERAAAWAAFKTQYDAVVSARKVLVEMQSDNNYPWAKDSLANALTVWDPYYNTIMQSGWVGEDGSDTRKATIDELKDWTDYHGVEMYDAESNRLKYQLARGYQNATNYVKAQNKVFADLKDEITKAETLRDDDMNQLGDKTMFQAAIDAAQSTYTTTLATTTDATAQADSVTVATAIETLKAAEEAFKASVPELKPIIDIDFSNGFEPIISTIAGEEGEEPVEQTTGYAIKGTAGQMEFTLASVTANEDGTYANDQTTFALGCGGADVINGDILRIGKGTATVNLAEGDIPTNDEVLRTTFDIWFGALINRSVTIELQNAAGKRVAGFSYSLYDGAEGYNDFNNAANEGLKISSYGQSTGKDGDASLLADKYKWQFDLIVDYKANTVQANLTTSPKGAAQGGLIALTKALEDNKIAKFVLSSNYDNTGRRSWFDNLKIVKYNSSAQGENEQVGITNVNATTASNAIYTLSGVKVNGTPAKGLYIQNGKKFIIK